MNPFHSVRLVLGIGIVLGMLNLNIPVSEYG